MANLLLVVVYERALSQSETLVSLSAQQGLLGGSQVLVWDNSKGGADGAEVQWLRGALPQASYLHHPENPGLATVYNTIIRDYLCTPSGKQFDFLLLLDHDSTIPDTFLPALRDGAEKYPAISLFLPIVTCRGQIVSPANLRGFKGSHWKKKETGLIAVRHKTAINSGMAISSTYLRNVFGGYDERFRLYNIDNYFMREYARTNAHFVVLDAVIHHDLAVVTDQGRESRLWRHRETIRSLHLLSDGSWLRETLTFAYCSLYSLRQTIKYRDLRFLA